MTILCELRTEVGTPAAEVISEKRGGGIATDLRILGLAVRIGQPFLDREQVVDVLLKHPRLMQRPVCVLGDRAVIARPSEKVLELLS